MESFDEDEDVLKLVNLISMGEILDDQENNKEAIESTKNVIRRNDVSFICLRNRQRIVHS